jgi:hypothetical protein
MMSPQSYLYEILRNRGYSKASLKPFNPKSFKSAPLAPEQQSAYNRFMVELVRRATDEDLLLAAYFHTQLCNNPCLASGESILHLICQFGDNAFLQLVSGSQFSDDAMPTPCQAPRKIDCSCVYGPASFLMAQLILERDILQLLRKDAEGILPLQHVPREFYQEWNSFLDIVQDTYWPEALPQEDDDTSSTADFSDQDESQEEHDDEKECQNDTTRQETNARLHISLARMVNTSRMSMDEAAYLDYVGGDDDTTTHGHDHSMSSIGDLEEGVADLMLALDRFIPKRRSI